MGLGLAIAKECRSGADGDCESSISDTEGNGDCDGLSELCSSSLGSSLSRHDSVVSRLVVQAEDASLFARHLKAARAEKCSASSETSSTVSFASMISAARSLREGLSPASTTNHATFAGNAEKNLAKLADLPDFAP